MKDEELEAVDEDEMAAYDASNVAGRAHEGMDAGNGINHLDPNAIAASTEQAGKAKL